jgi:hypothetical protein
VILGAKCRGSKIRVLVVIAVGHRARDRLYCAKVGSALWDVAQRPGAELVVKFVLEQ